MLNIKEIRESMDLTREEFAQILGQHMTTIYRWETSTPHPEKLNLAYINAMQEIITKIGAKVLGNQLKESLIMGRPLLAINTLLNMFYSERKKDGV